MDVVDFAWHVVVAANYVNFVLDEEWLVANSKLVHVVEGLPVLCVQVEQMDLAVTVGVLTTNEKDLAVGNGQGWAGPKRILHTDCEHLPQVLVNFVHLDSVVDFLFSAAKETSKSVYEFISHGAGTQVVSLVFHWSNLVPFVLLNIVLFNWAKSLLTRETTKYENGSLANGDCVGISTFSHLGFVEDLVFQSEIDSGIFLWWRSTTSDQYFCWS